MKKTPAGVKFSSNDEVIDRTNIYFAELGRFYFLEKLRKLESG